MDRHRKRSVDVLEEVEKLSCCICKRRPSDCHHVITVGAGGDDSRSNCIPLCRRHHQETHLIGVRTFYNKYKSMIDLYYEICGEVKPDVFDV